MMRLAFAGVSLAAFCARADKPLPSVDTVLTKAASKAHDFAQQALAMQQKLEEQQAQSRALLDKQMGEYELRLKEQYEQSQAIERQNTELQSSNKKLEAMNSDMAAELKTWREKNDGLRSTLQQIDDKVSAAQLFLADSLKVTDDSNSKELEVLIPAAPKPTLDHFLAATSGKMSLLAISSSPPKNPEEIIQGLSASLAEISDAAKEGAEELKAHFLKSFEEGRVRQLGLNATHADLMQSQTQINEHKAKLIEAKMHLLATNKALVERLAAVRAFADKVDSSAATSLRRA